MSWFFYFVELSNAILYIYILYTKGWSRGDHTLILLLNLYQYFLSVDLIYLTFVPWRFTPATEGPIGFFVFIIFVFKWWCYNAIYYWIVGYMWMSLLPNLNRAFRVLAWLASLTVLQWKSIAAKFSFISVWCNRFCSRTCPNERERERGRRVAIDWRSLEIIQLLYFYFLIMNEFITYACILKYMWSTIISLLKIHNQFQDFEIIRFIVVDP